MLKTKRWLSWLMALVTALLVLSGSIAAPLLCRPFYYAQIGPLGLEAQTGLTRGEIQTAFDQVMDFCLGLRPDFAAGILPFSPSGASHFADVRGLFLMDLWVLGLSALALAGLFVLCRKRKLRPALLAGHGPGFWAAIGLGAVFAVLGGLAATDFDRAFVLFHSLFFPGKTNWIFDGRTDPVIWLLPEQFFARCALLILALLLVWCALLIGADLWACRRRKRQWAAMRAAAPECMRKDIPAEMP